MGAIVPESAAVRRRAGSLIAEWLRFSVKMIIYLPVVGECEVRIAIVDDDLAKFAVIVFLLFSCSCRSHLIWKKRLLSMVLILRQKILRSSRHIAVLSVAAALSACAQVETKPSPVATPQATSDTEKSSPQQVKNVLNQEQAFDSKVGAAIASPLSDLNLVNTDIPEVLLKAKMAPYALPAELSCAWLQEEVQGLSAVLGPDVDQIKRDASGNLIDQGSDVLGNAAVNALRSFTEGVIPFRAWIRRLTGADRSARELAAAGIAGIVRRSYLKGYQMAKGCAAGAPNPAPEPLTAPIK